MVLDGKWREGYLVTFQKQNFINLHSGQGVGLRGKLEFVIPSIENNYGKTGLFSITRQLMIGW